ncbi:MAG: 30S ribosomal protein S2 [Bacteroidales bacterium]|nr:30S ribosomal protein S2 [Bacteroidales bacterium]
MTKVTFDELLDAGVHFGHLTRKWNPAMAPYIFMERNGIHIIDLHKTVAKLDEATAALKQIAKSGKRILFVATKKQAKDIVAEEVKRTGMPYVTERWAGGMLTNFITIRKAVKKMATIDKMIEDPSWANFSKRERLQITRERAKLEKTLGSIADMRYLPTAVFIVDICKEHIAVQEARKLGIPTFAITDTNTNPNLIDFPIPGNDDASKAIELVVKAACDAIIEGLEERKFERDKNPEEQAAEDNEDEFEEKTARTAEEEEEEGSKKGRRPRKSITRTPVNKH